ncbi:MAG: DUF2330 domain-containing protein [Myxococcota bacterium]
MKRFAVATVLSSLAVAGAFLLAPAEAEACGGTFCDGGPAPMPVDQSGENILFVRDGNSIEAHIQIQYEGDAERFGWVIPLQGVPEVTVGSDPLFQALLAGSVPTYTTQNTADNCELDDGGDEGGDPGAPDGNTGGAGGDDGADDGGGVNVEFQETVGAFEFTVLSGTQAEDVNDWLKLEGYQTDEAALPILQEYLDEGHVMGAVKLTAGADVQEIHPIVLRFESDEPCIPLRLTRIAATDDMDVRAFFLGEDRVVPKSYKHVEINPLKIDWLNFAMNYKELISLAVDSPMAEGRAFVTEYAGDSSVVQQGGLVNPQLDPDSYELIDIADVVDTLGAQGAYFCDPDFGCGGTHPLIEPILLEFVPVPDGVDKDEFYSCLSCFADEIDMMAWDGKDFGAALTERVIEPGQHAERILNQNSYLTRMYTTISPNEMMKDPMFHENPDLDEVAAFQTGTRRFLCNGDSVYTLPDGREVYLPAGTTEWPDFEEEEAWHQPWEEEVQEVMTAGAPIVLATNTEAIDVALAAYNAAHGWPGGGADGGEDAGDDGDGADGTSGGADGGDGGDDGAGADGTGEGCGCRTDNAPAGFAWALAFGFGLLFARRRN